MRKIYKELNEDEKARGVIFSSHLIGGCRVHEVTQEEMEEDAMKAKSTIMRLIDDKFFNNSPFSANEIRSNEKIRRLYNLTK